MPAPLALLLILLTAAVPAPAAQVRFEPEDRRWVLSSGDLELRFRQTDAGLALEDVGLNAEAVWPRLSLGLANAEAPGTIVGKIDGQDVTGRDLAWISAGVEKQADGRDELRLLFKIARWQISGRVRCSAGGETGVFTFQTSLTNEGPTAVRIQSWPSLVCQLPAALSHVSYLTVERDGAAEFATQALPMGLLELAGPPFRPWLALGAGDGGGRLVAQLLWPEEPEMRFRREYGAADPGSTWTLELGRYLAGRAAEVLEPGQTLDLPVVALTASGGDLDAAVHALHKFQTQFAAPSPALDLVPIAFRGPALLSTNIPPNQVKAWLDLAADLGADLYLLDRGWNPILANTDQGTPMLAGVQLFDRYLKAKGVRLAASLDLTGGPGLAFARQMHREWIRTNQSGGELVDFRLPAVRQWGRGLVDRLVQRGGISWIRFEPGGDATVAAADLEELGRWPGYLRQWTDWLDDLRRQYPQVTFEDGLWKASRASWRIGTRRQATNTAQPPSVRRPAQVYASTLELAPARRTCRLDLSGVAAQGEMLGALDGALGAAMTGLPIIEAESLNLPTNALALVRGRLAAFKRWRSLLREGDAYPLLPPEVAEATGWWALQFLSRDRHRSVVLACRWGGSASRQVLPLRHLLDDGAYEVVADGGTPLPRRGAQLNALPVVIDSPLGLKVYELTWVNAEPVLPIDGQALGRTYEGVGALSAGGSSRLLPDYPETARRDILDLLFKPQAGASFQHLKVEVGGDVNSTSGSEPSHMRARDEKSFERGYEWWLMKEAKQRNPQVALDALQWGAPGWIGNGHFYSQDNVDYLLEFLRGARARHGLTFDYLGIWNEVRYDTGWIKLLRAGLDTAGFSGVRLVAPDEVDRWSIAPLLRMDAALAKSVDVLGVHYPKYVSSPEAKQSGKPLWASEDGPWRSDWSGAQQWARILNRNYIEGEMTKTIIWSLAAAYYDNLPNPSTGVIKANQPWSGHYEIKPTFWVTAHTTQFAEPGWKYVRSGCGYLPWGGSLVSLCSPTLREVSLIAETMDATRSQTLAFMLTGGLERDALQVWGTSAGRWFEQLPPVRATNQVFSMTLAPGSIYSFTSVRGPTKPSPTIPPPAPFPRSYKEDFERYLPGALPRFFSEQGGIFEVATRTNGGGQCLRQSAVSKGIEWESHLTPAPETILGDANWRNYHVGVDVLLESEGFVSLFGRVGKIPQSPGPPAAYWLKVNQRGDWELGVEKHPIASGKVGFSTNRWHHLELSFRETQIDVAIDHVKTASVQDTTYLGGMIALGSGWNGAQFDNLQIEVDPSDLNLAWRVPARASSQADADSGAAQANDGDGFTTRWSAQEGRTAGEWLEVDFGRPTTFSRVVLKPSSPSIGSYAVQYWNGDSWREAMRGQNLGNGSASIGFPAVRGSKARFYVTEAASAPSLWEFEIFHDAERGAGEAPVDKE
ncbi:MAG: discoidin domain-containing protein [Verrucomicrobiota bacterium]